MSKYSKNLRDCLSVKVIMMNRIEGKTSEKGADRAMLVLYAGFFLFLSFVGFGIMHWFMN